MPSRSDKWKDEVTIFSPIYEAEVKSTSSQAETTSRTWMDRATLWNPLGKDLPRAASVSETYEWLIEERTRIGVKLREVSTDTYPNTAVDEHCSVAVLLLFVRKDIIGQLDVRLSPEVVGINVDLKSIYKEDLPLGVISEQATTRVSLNYITKGNDLHYRYNEPNVAVSVSLNEIILESIGR